jgi:D-glycero-alpha-D-manno-heptose-7-phosphate kinase
MLVARAPVRISFGGGGTDLPAYYDRYGGMVVSAAINKYFYTIISPASTDDGIQLISSDYHTFYRHDPAKPLFWDGQLSLPRAILHHFGIERGYSIFLASEVPPGTGLGSSGSVAVALVHALAALTHPLSKHEVAELACAIEIEKMGMPVGKQDQYGAAFGGLNVLHFERDGVEVEPLDLKPSVLTQLENSLLLFFTGTARDSASILSHQKQASAQGQGQVVEALHAIKALAVDVRACLEAGDLDAFGELLHAAWQHKKKLAPNVTSSAIDRYYTLAREAGAVGGKITGAGGGGFLMLYCPPVCQPQVTEVLEGEGLVRMDFRFDFQGATTVLDTLIRHHLYA